MSNDSSSKGVRFPFFDVGVVFVTLKLTDEITWPWLWVLAPFWSVLALATIVGFIGSMVVKRRANKALQDEGRKAVFNSLKHSNN